VAGGPVGAGRRRSRVVSALAVVAVGAVGLAASGCGESADLPAGTVARVGDNPITQAQLDVSVAQSAAAVESQGQKAPADGTEQFTQMQQQALDGLVQRQIILNEAALCGPPCAVDDAEVEAELQTVIANEFGDSRKEFEAFLDERKMSRADALAVVENSLLQQKLYDNVTRGVRFGEADARAYYTDNAAQFRIPAGRTASHILVPTKAEAERIRAEVTPANFAQIAKAESTDTGSAQQGGRLGVIQKGQMVPEFEKAAFALKDGEISQPVQSQFGWHIIMVELTPAHTTPFAEAKAGIISSQLQEKRQSAYSGWAEDAVATWGARTVYATDDLRPPDPVAPQDDGAPTEVPAP